MPMARCCQPGLASSRTSSVYESAPGTADHAKVGRAPWTMPTGPNTTGAVVGQPAIAGPVNASSIAGSIGALSEPGSSARHPAVTSDTSAAVSHGIRSLLMDPPWAAVLKQATFPHDWPTDS